MNTIKHNIKIQHDKFGVLMNETFIDMTQFKIFLKAVDGCIFLKNDFTFFNGMDFFIHIPYSKLVESIITTSSDSYDLSDHMKSKIEALVTK
jgi:hypothetical protein